MILSRHWAKAKPHSVSQALQEKASKNSTVRIGKTRIKGFKAVARVKGR